MRCGVRNAMRHRHVGTGVLWLLASICAGGLILVSAGAADTALTREEGHRLFLAHPDWLVPLWASGGPASWTMVGPPYAGTVTLIGADGSFAPRNHGPAISLWVYDLDAERLLVDGRRVWQFGLDDSDLPIVTAALDVDGVRIETTYLTSWPGGDPSAWFAQPGVGVEHAVTFVRLQVSSADGTSRRLAAYVALRPFGVEPDMHAIRSVACDASMSTLTADSAVAIVGVQPADGCVLGNFGGNEVSTAASRESMSPSGSVSDPGERAEGMLRYALTTAPAGRNALEFRVPLGARQTPSDLAASLRAGAFDYEREQVTRAWQAAISRIKLHVPDERLNAAFKASQAYLLLTRSADLPHSGPLQYDAFWVRDGAYIGQALERVGARDDNGATVDAMLALQRADGSFPAITNASDMQAMSANEWDSSGEAISSAVAHYRFTHDLGWLEQVYPRIARAAWFIDALRGQTLSEGPQTRSLLPVNLSAEDLGLSTWHHYWDDLWAIAGYREAAFAAGELGRSDDATAFANRANDLQAAVVRSIDRVNPQPGGAIVPNGPEDLVSSAMARGTTPALWPVHALVGQSAEDLLTRSFRTYDAQWLAPQSGGYRHYQDALWPYGGLGIAHAMLRLGMTAEVQEVLTWTIDHQTLPGTYAWGEGIDPQNGGLEIGDMPHSWAAAELISLLRDMLISEDEGWLVVNSGAPDAWFRPGSRVAVLDAPTMYGPATVVLTRAPDDVSRPPDLSVTLEGSPPNGWHLRLPGQPVRAIVDGVAREQMPTTNILTLEPGPHSVVVEYPPPL